MESLKVGVVPWRYLVSSLLVALCFLLTYQFLDVDPTLAAAKIFLEGLSFFRQRRLISIPVFNESNRQSLIIEIGRNLKRP